MSGLIQKGKCQFLDGSGNPLAGGSVTFYTPGTTTFKATYTDQGLTTQNPNPVVLDGNGEAVIWGTGLYTQIVQDANGNQIWSATGAAPLSSEDIQSGAVLFGLDTGTSNNYVVNRSTQATALVDGMQCWFRAANQNTGASVITVDGLATTPIIYEGAALPSGLITPNGYYGLQYQAVNSAWAVIFLANPPGGEWLAGPSPTYVSANSFTVGNDYTGTFTVGRRVQLLDNGAALYGTVQSVSYASATSTTTVVVLLDSGAIDSALTGCAFALLNAQNPSVPGLGLVPTGSLLAYAGSAAPPGWLLAQGQAISRTQYAALFAAIGTTYGAGDGSTTFNLPNPQGRSVIGVGSAGQTNTYTLGQLYGEELHALATAELAAHTHAATSVVSDPGHAHSVTAAAGEVGYNDTGYAQAANASVNTGTATTGVTVSTTNASTGSGTGHNTVHPVIAMNWIIKT